MTKSVKSIIITALIIAFAFICLFTNPGKDEYISWAKEHYTASADAKTSSLQINLREVFSQLFGSEIISEHTTTQNYVLFSLYQTSLSNKEVKVIGILNNFIPVYFSDSAGS